jgi:putative membrane protein
MARDLPSSEGSRLHRFSFFFVLLAQLWGFAPLLLAAFFVGRSDRYDGWEFIGTGVGALALSAYSLVYTLSFRYWLLDDEIVIKKGFFDRTLRHLPFARISNIAHKQNVLHRIFDVVELNLESGSGAQAEAKLTVLTNTQAAALEQQIRAYQLAGKPLSGKDRNLAQGLANSSSSAEPSAAISVDASAKLSEAALGDLIRLGLISNRGMLLIGGGFYFLSQTGLSKNNNVFKGIGNTVSGWLGSSHGPLFWVLSILFSMLLILIVVRIASIVVSIIQFYGFKLSGNESTLRTESGLLTRRGGQARIERIALIVINNGWLYRLFKRQGVQVYLPGNAMQGDSMERSGMTHLTPVGTPDHVQALIERIFELQISALRWQPLAAKAGRRMAKKALFFGALIWLPLLIFAGLKLTNEATAALCVAAALSMAWLFYSRHKDARESGYVLLPDFWIIKTGYFSQTIQLVRRDAIQSVSLSSSHFDRTSQMAGVRVDLMVTSMSASPKLKYLSQADAAQLFHLLRINAMSTLSTPQGPQSAIARSLVENASAVSAGA